MSAGRIQVGDLVVVAFAAKCCGHARELGRVFVVGDIHYGPGICSGCLCCIDDIGMSARGASNFFARARLQKIDPQTQPDAIPTAKPEEVTA